MNKIQQGILFFSLFQPSLANVERLYLTGLIQNKCVQCITEKMSCSIGIYLKNKCENESKCFTTSRNFPQRQWALLKLKSGVPVLNNVCNKHAAEYGRFYEVSQKVCCNPLKLHKIARRKSLRKVTADCHDKFNLVFPAVIEGRRLCRQCRKAICEKFEEGSLEPGARGEEAIVDEGKTGHLCYLITKTIDL